jgi:F0F1-type ATP synthase assembly protein I
MMAERGWDILRRIADMGPLQIVGILAIIGLVTVLVVMRRKVGATSTKTTKSTSTRI